MFACLFIFSIRSSQLIVTQLFLSNLKSLNDHFCLLVQALVEQTKSYRNQIEVLRERMKRLNQRRLPDSTPYKLNIDTALLTARSPSPRICLSHHASLSSLDSESGVKPSLQRDIPSDSADCEVASISNSATAKKRYSKHMPRISVSDHKNETDESVRSKRGDASEHKPPLPPRGSSGSDKVQIQSVESRRPESIDTMKEILPSPRDDCVVSPDRPSYADVASGKVSPHPVVEDGDADEKAGRVLLSRSELSSFHPFEQKTEMVPESKGQPVGAKLQQVLSSSDVDTSEPTSPVSTQSYDSASQSSYFVPIMSKIMEGTPTVIECQQITVHEARAPDGSGTISTLGKSFEMKHKHSNSAHQSVSETMVCRENVRTNQTLSYADVIRKSASLSDSGCSEDGRKNLLAVGSDEQIRFNTSSSSSNSVSSLSSKKDKVKQNQKNAVRPLLVATTEMYAELSRGRDDSDTTQSMEAVDSDATLSPHADDDHRGARPKNFGSTQKTKKMKRQSKLKSSTSTTDDGVNPAMSVLHSAWNKSKQTFEKHIDEPGFGEEHSDGGGSKTSKIFVEGGGDDEDETSPNNQQLVSGEFDDGVMRCIQVCLAHYTQNTKNKK